MASLTELLTQYKADIAYLATNPNGKGLKAAVSRVQSGYINILSQLVSVSETGVPSTSTYTAVPMTCGENISGDRVIVSINQLLYHFDPNNTSHAGKVVGISLQAGDEGTSINVAVSGVITWSGPTLTQDQRYYGASDGALTTNASSFSIIQSIGYALSPTKILIDLDTTILTDITT